MPEASFNTRLLTSLRRKLGEHYEVMPEFSPKSGLKKVQDLAVIEDGRLRMLIDIGADDLDEVKPEMRKFYGEMEDSDLVLAACNQEELVIFDADNDLVDEEYDREAAELIADEIAIFLGVE
ncbi:MAG: hypothetical protein ABEJ72_10760 [Candidatus Aenigmatarchaeota archaeon]